MFWILIQCFYVSSKSILLRIFIGIFIATAIINAMPVWSRQHHDDLHWKSHVYSCPLFPWYAIPIQFNGDKTKAWSFRLSGKKCTELLKHDLFSQTELNKLPTFPYRVLNKVLKLDQVVSNEREPATLISSTMTGTDYQKSNIKGHRVIGSFDTSGTGEVFLKLQRGNHILYRSGPNINQQSVAIQGQEHVFLTDLPPAKEWVKLSFSNSKLPPKFVVVIKDDGHGFGEWSAVAIKN